VCSVCVVSCVFVVSRSRDRRGWQSLTPVFHIHIHLQIAKRVGTQLITEQDKALRNEEKKVELEPHMDKLGFFSA
jgi:hypothetical protein